MSGTGASLNDKIDLAPWGYAPGTSIATCVDCSRTKSDPEDAVFIGHKHAHRCVEHALTVRHSVIRAQEGELVPDPDQLLADEVHSILRGYIDQAVRYILIAICAAPFIGAWLYFH